MVEGVTPFGEQLRRLRIAANLSQEELAERAGLSQRGISDLERGARRSPRPETVRLLADALSLDGSERAELTASARPRPLGTGVTTLPGVAALPMPLTRLIGRESETTTLVASLARGGARLVTITGAGGTGKTRLALEVATRLRDRDGQEVASLDLAALADPALVNPALAAVLGVREIEGEQLRDTLIAVLATRRLLIVLDNCEHLLAATPDIAALLVAAHGLAILATSREPLRVRGELEFPLQPLALPAAERSTAVEDLAHVPAVALFVERATAAVPDFALTAQNAAAIVAICRRLDGLPLALELAAAKTKVLPPDALLARLERRLPLLTGGGRDLPARQRTMRDAIAWSYDLLASDEQHIFCILAVFAGGFTLSAAEAVACAGTATTVLEAVTALVEQSLLRQVPGPGPDPRYQMLETVREFGLERLTDAGEIDQARERHARYFLRLTDRRDSGIQIYMDVDQLAAVAPEQENACLALAWFEERGEVDALLALGTALYGPWLAHGLYGEGLRWLDRALERSNRAASAARGRALVAAGMLAIFQGDYARAALVSRESVALARALDDPLLVGQALLVAGFLAYRQGEYAHGGTLLSNAVIQLDMLGESAPGAAADAAFALVMQGSTELLQGAFGRAIRLHEAALVRWRRVGNAWGIGDAQVTLAVGLFCDGDMERAAAMYAEGLEMARALDLPHVRASALIGLAAVAAKVGQPAVGARLLGAGEAINAARGAPMYLSDRPVFERGLAVMQAALGDERLERERAAGRIADPDVLFAEASAVAAAARV